MSGKGQALRGAVDPIGSFPMIPPESEPSDDPAANRKKFAFGLSKT